MPPEAHNYIFVGEGIIVFTSFRSTLISFCLVSKYWSVRTAVYNGDGAYMSPMHTGYNSRRVQYSS